jgi:hypothetical protein
MSEQKFIYNVLHTRCSTEYKIMQPALLEKHKCLDYTVNRFAILGKAKKVTDV